MRKKSRYAKASQRAAGGERAVCRSILNGLARAFRNPIRGVGNDGVPSVIKG